MIFKNISQFNNVNDYLPILNGCINADLIIIFLLFHNIIKSTILKKWYKKFGLSAVIMDVSIVMIGILIVRFFYSYLFNEFSILYFTMLVIAFQIIYDYLFYLLFTSTPIGYSYILDFFKLYSKEHGYKIILGDSAMVILACLLSSYFATFNFNLNIITLIISVYFIPYMIYYEA